LIRKFEKNILKFSDLLNEIWKNKELYFNDLSRVVKDWNEVKITILNSRILEHLFTTSLKKSKLDEITKLESGMKRATGTIKMKLIKTVVEKMDCLERPIYYLANNGNTFYHIPNREFFRQNYENLEVQFDYHVKFEVNEVEEEKNDFNMKVKILLNNEDLLGMDIIVSFGLTEFNSKLKAKYKFEIPSNFNYLLTKTEEE
jgi:hypothetical protein